MPARKILFTITLLFLALSTGGCSPSGETSRDANPLPRAVVMPPPAPLPTPEPSGALAAANNFLNWYLNFGVDSSGLLLSPFEVGGHRTCDCVSPAYQARIDAEVGLPPDRRVPYEPVANRFGLIDSVSADLFAAEGFSASVIAELDGMDWSRQITIDLIYTDERWLVDDIRGASIAAPEGVTQLFYEWYLDYYHSTGDPLADGAYKFSPYLSESYINWVNSVQTSFDNDGFDPFLMSRAVPTGISIMEVRRDGDQAVVLVNRFLLTAQPNPLVVHLEKQGVYWRIVDVTIGEVPATPAEVVESFYEWYRDYTNSSSAGELRNPLVDGAYQVSPFLTAEFIDRVDEQLNSLRGGGFDPFVCAQVIPDQITTDGTYLSELYGPAFANRASVVVRTEYSGHVFTVDLVRPEQGEDWQISDIVCAGTPAGAVKAFYTWVQGCLEESPTCRLPGEDYRTSGFVTAAFIDQIETLKAAFQAAGLSGFSPITLSQAQIPAFHLETLSQDDRAASVLLTNQAQLDHALLIELVIENGVWKINNIRSYIENTPAAVTRAFYNQYIALRQNPQDPGVLYNFQPDRLLSPELQQSVEAYLRAGMSGGRDPILLANSIPERIAVEEAVRSETSAVVVVALYEDGTEPASLSVDLRLIDGIWRISGVR